MPSRYLLLIPFIAVMIGLKFTFRWLDSINGASLWIILLLLLAGGAISTYLGRPGDQREPRVD
jgi:hypothetical protein